MHIHILGICGTFMGGIAQLAKSLGIEVSGCDAGVYPPMSDQLKQAGIHLIEGYDPEQLDAGADLYIIGNAISRGNPLLEEILNRGLPYTSGPQWLQENILNGRHVLAVAGTHGKTTTTSMLAWILEDCGLNPSFLIGGVPQNFGHSARLTESEYFVIEADEYDTAFFDKRSKFVHYRPRTVILNNLEYDHADIFPNLEAIERQFHHLVRTIPSHGQVIFNEASEALHRVLKMGLWTPAESFGTSPVCDWRLVEHEGARLFAGGKEVGRFELSLPGEHNLLNASAAVAAAVNAGVSAERAVDALSRFEGVKRRMEVKGEVAGTKVIDDFAHHPTAIEETIKAVRSKYQTGRLLAVLEPRSNTMKLGTMKAQLPGSLVQADKVFCYQGPAVQWDTAAALAPLGEKAEEFKDLEALVEDVVSQAEQGDTILVMSNGGFGGVHKKLLDGLKSKFGA